MHSFVKRWDARIWLLVEKGSAHKVIVTTCATCTQCSEACHGLHLRVVQLPPLLPMDRVPQLPQVRACEWCEWAAAEDGAFLRLPCEDYVPRHCIWTSPSSLLRRLFESCVFAVFLLLFLQFGRAGGAEQVSFFSRNCVLRAKLRWRCWRPEGRFGFAFLRFIRKI